jgi:predicted metal-binding protein
MTRVYMIKLIAIIQCSIVHERCSGYYCDRAYVMRTGGFENLDLSDDVRKLSFTCGGCCGRAVHRRLSHLKRKARQTDNIEAHEILVKLSSCMTRDNYHGPPCPHLDYIKELIQKTGISFSCDTAISIKAQEKRAAGVYRQS